MTLRCLIIDDKPLAIDLLSDYVQKTPFLELAATTTNPIEGLQFVREKKADLVLLDIQMPELTGLQFLKIAGNQCKFILTTAYADYALDGFEHGVADYLLKPISFDRFYRAAERALQLHTTAGNTIEPAAGLPDVHTPAEFLFVKTEHRIQRIDLQQLLYIEGLQNYISLQTSTGRVMSLQSLKAIEEQLPATHFIRVHRSFIVNLRHITVIEKSRIFIQEAVIPLGDTYRNAFYRMIDNGRE